MSIAGTDIMGMQSLSVVVTPENFIEAKVKNPVHRRYSESMTKAFFSVYFIFMQEDIMIRVQITVATVFTV